MVIINAFSGFDKKNCRRGVAGGAHTWTSALGEAGEGSPGTKRRFAPLVAVSIVARSIVARSVTGPIVAGCVGIPVIARSVVAVSVVAGRRGSAPYGAQSATDQRAGRRTTAASSDAPDGSPRGCTEQAAADRPLARIIRIRASRQAHRQSQGNCAG